MRSTPAARRWRWLAAAALLAVLSLRPWPVAAADGCDCFSPEMRRTAGQEALQKARLAVYGRVIEVGPAGQTKVLVLESFKGPPREATTIVDVLPDAGQCKPSATFAVGDETLVLSFQPTTTPCDLYAGGHFLVDAFRQIAAQSK